MILQISCDNQIVLSRPACNGRRMVPYLIGRERETEYPIKNA